MRTLSLATLWALAAALALPGAASAQKRDFSTAVRNVSARFEPAEAKPGQTVTFSVTVELAEGWHTYPVTQADPGFEDNVTKIAFPTDRPVVFVGKLDDPPGVHEKTEPKLEGGTGQQQYYEGTVTWKRQAVVHPLAPAGPLVVKLSKLNLQVCDAKNCLPPRSVPVEAALTVLPGPAVPVESAYEQAVAAVKPSGWDTQVTRDPPTPPTKPDPTPGDALPVSAEQYRAALDAIAANLVPADGATTPTPSAGGGAGGGEFVAFLLAAVFWGAVTLVTPCVFPMIPITVSFFLHKKEGGPSPLFLAAIYCGTIVVVLSVAALLLLQTFRALSVNPIMNFGLAAVFVVFALSLFGMFELTLPAWLTGVTSAREGRGVVGTVFMALTFTLVSFSCVAPFLGGFSGMVSSGRFSWLQLACGALAFSGTFAAPFFLLALFPALLKKLPKSGNWLNVVKVSMGFLELAAALKFLRTGELMLTSEPTLFTFDLVLGLYVALAVAAGLYLLNTFRLPHDEPQEHVGVPRFLAGLTMLGLALYLTPALFAVDAAGTRQRPAGFVYAWIDSFLLPDTKAESFDLAKGLADAKAENKKVFVDFTGVTCTNCRLNERDVFSKSEVRDLMHQYKIVQMYTDRVPNGRPLAEQTAEAEANLAFQRKAFDNETLPLYFIFDPNRTDGKIAYTGPYPEGKINDERAFVKFLRDGLRKQKP